MKRFVGGHAGWLFLLLAVVAMLPTGCARSVPDASSWRSDAVQALDQVASDLATMQLVATSVSQDQLPINYATVLAVSCESDSSGAIEQLTAQQPAVGEEDRYWALRDLLDSAGALLSKSRMALARVDSAALPGLADELTALGHEIAEERSTLQ